ncbi:MAG: glycoside hydrolase family 99-like domain-containing protein [Acidobacteriota bacterium]
MPLKSLSDVMIEQGKKTQLIAFYLPQFHPIPENDEWWGSGFTEWTNVVRAKPRFRGHDQPQLPADLGFYDLRLPEVRNAQASLAAEYGIDGFCYYHYWFNGRRLLERPFNEVLQSGEPDFPFCLCWANENWSRRWDGLDNQILLSQQYSAKDDIAHIRALVPALTDPRYIRLDGRPLFLVYRAGLLPDALATTERWRAEYYRLTKEELFLCRVIRTTQEIGDPRQSGFDAAVEFHPFWEYLRFPLPNGVLGRLARRARLLGKAYGGQLVYDYREYVDRALCCPLPDYPNIPCVFPSWDNSARRERAAVLIHSSPAKYQQWLTAAIKQAEARPVYNQHRLVFINAWNEWAEGAYLEPSQKWGRAYLEATHSARLAAGPELFAAQAELAVRQR